MARETESNRITESTTRRRAQRVESSVQAPPAARATEAAAVKGHAVLVAIACAIIGAVLSAAATHWALSRNTPARNPAHVNHPGRSNFLDVVLDGSGVSKEAFVEGYYGKRPLLIRASPGTAVLLAMLPSLHDVEDIAFKCETKLVKDGKSIDTETWHMPRPKNRFEAATLRGEFARGASIVSDNLHNQGFGARAVEWVERALTTVVSLNLYTSPSALLQQGTTSTGRAYDTHIDTHGVWAAQIHGQKTWTTFEPTMKSPVELVAGFGWYPPIKPRGGWKRQIANFTLRKGDVFYIPRGIPHHATITGEGLSVHVSMSTTTATSSLLHLLLHVIAIIPATGQLSHLDDNIEFIGTTVRNVLGSSLTALSQHIDKADTMTAADKDAPLPLQLRRAVPYLVSSAVVSMSPLPAKEQEYFVHAQHVLSMWAEWLTLPGGSAMEQAWSNALLRANSKAFTETPLEDRNQELQKLGWRAQEYVSKGVLRAKEVGEWGPAFKMMASVGAEVARSTDAAMLTAALLSAKFEAVGTAIAPTRSLASEMHSCQGLLYTTARIRPRVNGLVLEHEVLQKVLNGHKARQEVCLDLTSPTERGTIHVIAASTEGDGLLTGLPERAKPALEFLFRQVHNSRGFTLEEWDMGKHVRSTVKKVALMKKLMKAGIEHIVDVYC